MRNKVLGAVAVILVLAVAGVYWFVVRDDAPAELSIDTPTEGSTESAGGSLDSYDGTWTVRTGEPTTAGFRIDEEFAGAISHTAVGRSPDVEGTLTVGGSEVSDGSFTVDLTALEFTDDPPTGSVGNRAGAMQSRGLQTDEFPDATFALTEPIDLGDAPVDGFSTTTEATGEMTIHGVTNEITFSVDAQVEGDTVRIASTEPVPVPLADYDMEVATPPFIASVSDEGSFEFLLVMAQG